MSGLLLARASRGRHVEDVQLARASSGRHFRRILAVPPFVCTWIGDAVGGLWRRAQSAASFRGQAPTAAWRGAEGAAGWRGGEPASGWRPEKPCDGDDC